MGGIEDSHDKLYIVFILTYFSTARSGTELLSKHSYWEAIITSLPLIYRGKKKDCGSRKFHILSKATQLLRGRTGKRMPTLKDPFPSLGDKHWMFGIQEVRTQ